MENRLYKKLLMPFIIITLLLFFSTGYAENIDPDNDNSQYAWGENVGWLNLEPDVDGSPGVEVGDYEITGYIWGENIGWISLSCLNKPANCSPIDWGVSNENGILSGYAWGENVGWINFSCSNPETCATVYGVTISPATGVFSGYAWGENIGWINFAPDGFSVKTSWPSVTDADGDGSNSDEDCNDSDPNINPGATEACDGVDNDCDGAVDEGAYDFGGFQQPINPDGSSIFKRKRTIPVKIVLTDCSGQLISTATVTIAVYKITNSVLGTEVEQNFEPSGNANTGNLFRYDDSEGQYIFNLSTKTLSKGTYRLRATSDNGASYLVGFSLN